MIKSNFIMLMPFIMNMILILLLNYPSKLNKLHPISLMITLIMLTFMTTIKMNYVFNSWLSMIMFLIMIGGLMIIFMYITSLSNNEFFYLNFNVILSMLLKIIMIMTFMMFLLYYFNKMIYFIPNVNNLINHLPNFNMNLLYMKFYNKSTLFLMIYLFYSMIIIMNICLTYKLPLRQIMF